MATRIRASATAFRAFGLAAWVATTAFGCGGSVQELEPTKADGLAGRRQFRVECIEIERCKREASVACGSTYQVVSEWHNAIPESDLPGLNEATRPKDARDWNRYRLQNRTGIESADPMPLTSIVVACNG
jgi:hypothetical protein